MKSTAEKTADNLLNQAREIIIKHDTHSIKKALEKIRRSTEKTQSNRRTKEKYDKLIMDIGKSFREQIKG